jgi:hypothetical protein
VGRFLYDNWEGGGYLGEYIEAAQALGHRARRTLLHGCTAGGEKKNESESNFISSCISSLLFPQVDQNMGRKKKRVDKPVCWYCDRSFEDEKILIQHQKAKHYKCAWCHKKCAPDLD